MSHTEATSLDGVELTLGGAGTRIVRAAGLTGLAALAVAAAVGLAMGDGLRRLGFSYLFAFTYFLTLSLGALFFVALQHVTRSSWSVVVRRLAEIAAMNLPLLGLLAIPVLASIPNLYGWARPLEPGSHAAQLVAQKRLWLSPLSFAFRLAFYFTVWSLLARWFWRRSLGQDTSADPAVSVRMEKVGAPGLVAYGLTLTLAAFDLIMSLDPTWYSTIFGVYFFAGSVVGFFALLTLLSLGLQRSGRLTGIISMEHYHDLGKLMFAFTFFWAYIAFSQYLLIWYANLPEETGWYLRRQSNGWASVGLALLFCHFLAPFAGLVSRYAKRNRGLLAFWAVWLLIMHAVDLYWLIMPELGPGGPSLHPLDLLCWLGVGGLWAAGFARLAGGRPLVPIHDPRLADSLRFENA
ncbi:MAG: quinol:cytochrome C oxidoreductase [Candidatus Krumholzibacteriia bacterium]